MTGVIDARVPVTKASHAGIHRGGVVEYQLVRVRLPTLPVDAPGRPVGLSVQKIVSEAPQHRPAHHKLRSDDGGTAATPFTPPPDTMPAKVCWLAPRIDAHDPNDNAPNSNVNGAISTKNLHKPQYDDVKPNHDDGKPKYDDGKFDMDGGTFNHNRAKRKVNRAILNKNRGNMKKDRGNLVMNRYSRCYDDSKTNVNGATVTLDDLKSNHDGTPPESD
jgi:hypothetical protein